MLVVAGIMKYIIYRKISCVRYTRGSRFRYNNYIIHLHISDNFMQLIQI